VRDAGAYFTGPSSSILALVSASRGVEAKTQTPPSRSLIAVERPPKGITPNLLNGLQRCNSVSETSSKSWGGIEGGWWVEQVRHNSPGEDPDVFGDLSDDCFAHGCRQLRFTVRTEEVSGLKGGAFIHRGADEVVLILCAPLKVSLLA
jgi:hypothetical protein